VLRYEDVGDASVLAVSVGTFSVALGDIFRGKKENTPFSLYDGEENQKEPNEQTPLI
jgi:hypothetical protein